MTPPLNAFQKQIGYHFTDVDLLQLALTHPSCDSKDGDNQRLEFLGDAVLDLVVAETLYRTHPNFDEGTLDHMRASLVNGKALAAHAQTLQIASVLKVSQAQRQHHPEPSAAMLEDAFEAVIGAIHIDGGIDAARGVILNLLADALQAAAQSDQQGNPKGRLQEWAQQHHDGIVQDYIALPEQGPDHARIYGAAVELQGQELGRGQGSSKKAAESAAAENALQQLNQ